MSSISKVLVQLSHLDIFYVNRPTSIDVKGWVANQKYFFDSELSAGDFVVRTSDDEYLKAALANDCNRMAIATIESISGVGLERDLVNSGAWGVIRTYYSCFFAIHSIMRMFGISCSQLDQSHLQKLYESADVVGKSAGLSRIDSGFYAIRIGSDFSSASFHKYKDSHKDTWGEFLLLIESLSEQSRNAAALGKYKIEVFDVLSSVKKGITRSGCADKGNWLSVIRNSVNYQHSHGVWFPYERKVVAPSYMSSLSSDWRKSVVADSVDLRRSDIEIFFEVSILICSLFRELLLGCAEKAGNRNPVFRNGSLRLLKALQAA